MTNPDVFVIPAKKIEEIIKNYDYEWNASKEFRDQNTLSRLISDELCDFLYTFGKTIDCLFKFRFINEKKCYEYYFLNKITKEEVYQCYGEELFANKIKEEGEGQNE